MNHRTRGRLAAAAATTAAAAAVAGLTGAGAVAAEDSPAASAAQTGRQLVLGRATIGALAAKGGTAYAVLEPAERTIQLVRSNGRTASKPKFFGGERAEFPDIAAGEDGVVAAWGGRASGGEVWFTASVDRLKRDENLGLHTGPARVALDGSDALFAGPDFKGDVVVLRSGRGDDSRETLTHTGPIERHLPLDIGVSGGDPVVLDLVQTRSSTVLQVVGGPTAPVVRRGRLEIIEGTLAVDGDTLRVAYMRGGRAYLATANATAGGRWTTKRLRGPGRGTGGAAVVADGQVLYTQRGRGGKQDVFLADGKRLRRLTRTRANESEPMLASDGTRLFAAWTRDTGPKEAILQRVR